MNAVLYFIINNICASISVVSVPRQCNIQATGHYFDKLSRIYCLRTNQLKNMFINFNMIWLCYGHVRFYCSGMFFCCPNIVKTVKLPLSVNKILKNKVQYLILTSPRKKNIAIRCVLDPSGSADKIVLDKTV